MSEQTIDAAVEAVETVVEAIDATPEVVRNNPAVIFATAIVAAGLGAGVSFYLTKRYFVTKYETLIEEEIDKARQLYKRAYKADEYSDPEALAEKYLADKYNMSDPAVEKDEDARDISEKEGYVSYNDVPKKDGDVTVVKNIFVENDEPEDDFDIDVEMEKRDDGQPYIIEKEQFFENDTNYSQTTLTYYEEDDVLLDENDHIIENQIRILGGDNNHFGRGSGDKNIVYIRNEKLEADYEVVRSLGSYAEEVLGLSPKEFKAPMRKLRIDD